MKTALRSAWQFIEDAVMNRAEVRDLRESLIKETARTERYRRRVIELDLEVREWRQIAEHRAMS